MSTTLVVSYLPAGDRSFSKKLLDRFLEKISGSTEVIHRNLLKTLPPVFDEVSLAAYQSRNYGGQTLEGAFAESIKPFDALVQEFKKADQVVFAFPMHNFSIPGVVKTYIDAIMFHRELFQYGEKGPEGLARDLKLAVLYATGGQYESGSQRNSVPFIFDSDFGLAGVTDKTYIAVQATLFGPEAAQKSLESALKEVDALVEKWASHELEAALA